MLILRWWGRRFRLPVSLYQAGRCRGRPAQAVGRLWTGGNGPELHQNLSANEYGFLASDHVFYGRLRDGVFRTLRIRQSQEHVRIEKPTH